MECQHFLCITCVISKITEKMYVANRKNSHRKNAETMDTPPHHLNENSSFEII